MNSRISEITKAIEKGGEISPFLFLGENLETLHHELEVFILNLLGEYGIDSQSLFHMRDTGESIKTSEIKNFISRGDIRPRFAFQVFFIEDISRMTRASQNACLKFFEEPGEGNIIILTTCSPGGILDTILSRVQIIQSSHRKDEVVNNFYYSLIESHVSGSSDELVRYFFSGKYEKDEYIEFLKSLIRYISNTGKFIDILDEIHEDIGGIAKNNLQGRYIVDKYVMILGA